ncbi:hypothetical protein [Gottfriedia solisilvae]|uniref:hypothetical protein n=1 Tax=Gottfriedia solisilvae TaxID=1516104 RepID=UPI003D2EAD12
MYEKNIDELVEELIKSPLDLKEVLINSLNTIEEKEKLLQKLEEQKEKYSELEKQFNDLLDANDTNLYLDKVAKKILDKQNQVSNLLGK